MQHELEVQGVQLAAVAALEQDGAGGGAGAEQPADGPADGGDLDLTTGVADEIDAGGADSPRDDLFNGVRNL